MNKKMQKVSLARWGDKKRRKKGLQQLQEARNGQVRAKDGRFAHKLIKKT